MSAICIKRPHYVAAFLFPRFLPLLCLLVWNVSGADWEDALARMPVEERKLRFQKLEVASIMLKRFTTNKTVRALVFLPSATDYIYFNKTTALSLTKDKGNLLGAVRALTNQTPLRATFQDGFLFIHAEADRLTANVSEVSESAVTHLKNSRAPSDFILIDRAWEHFHEQAASAFRPLTLKPQPNDPSSFHFYRCYLRAHDLSSWELLKLLTIATKTRCTIHEDQVVFAEVPAL